MKLFKGWKTITFNVLVIALAQWGDVQRVVEYAFNGNEAMALSVLGVINIGLRLITTSAVAGMWISKGEQNGVEVRKEKP